MSKKILVVDNHPVMLKWMTHILEKEGHQVSVAEDGLSALDLLKTYTPDIVFTDLIMPNINGEKLCQMIRQDPRLADAFLIVFSAIATEEEARVAHMEANACIAKGPFNKMGAHILAILDQLERDRSGIKPKGVVGLADTHPRQITKELLAVKRHFEMILKSIAEGILEITPEGRIIYANPRAVSLIGKTEERLLTSNLVELFHEADRERIRDLLSSGKTLPQFIADDSPVRINGKEVSISFFPIVEDGGKASILLLNDVSERKRMKAQLFQAQKMEAIGTLAGGIAHDFNNLMMVIQGNTSLMLLDIDPNHPHYERLQSIEKQVQNGSRLTGQLLGYARKGRYEMKPIDLNQLIEETSEIFGRTRKGITIHKTLFENLSSIEADQGQIEQVLMNLFVNAADAMPQGGKLFLKTANVNQGDMQGKFDDPMTRNYVFLSLTDTGIGMDQKTMERIFDPFFTTKEPGRGTGLGLASVYGIIQAHGGYIDVKSEKGKGTTFEIYLPASERKVQEVIKPMDRMMQGTETILLIDDEEMILEIGQRLLKAMGYRTLFARDGKEAIELYKKERESIALVLLDMVMPDMGGGEVFDRLKEINSNVKVLLSSGYSLDGEATKILERGCGGFIQKPFDMKQLSRSIRAILDKGDE